MTFFFSFLNHNTYIFSHIVDALPIHRLSLEYSVTTQRVRQIPSDSSGTEEEMGGERNSPRKPVGLLYMDHLLTDSFVETKHQGTLPCLVGLPRLPEGIPDPQV